MHFPFLLGSAILMGAATLTKLYPILLAPIILRYLWPERRACFLWGTAYASTGALFLLGLYLAYDLEAVLGPVRWQTGHREVYGPTIYDVLTYRLAANDWVGQLFRRGVVLGTLCLLLITRPVNLASVLRRGAIILIVFMSLAVFYSPQWLLWLMPLLLPLTRSVSRSGHTGWVLVFLIVVMDLFTFWTVPVDYWEVSSAVFISRFLILIVVGLPLLRGHQTPKDTMPDRDQSGSPSLPPVLTSQ